MTPGSVILDMTVQQPGLTAEQLDEHLVNRSDLSKTIGVVVIDVGPVTTEVPEAIPQQQQDARASVSSNTSVTTTDVIPARENAFSLNFGEKTYFLQFLRSL